MRKATRKAIVKLICGERREPRPGCHPLYDLLMQLIEEEIEYAINWTIEEADMALEEQREKMVDGSIN